MNSTQLFGVIAFSLGILLYIAGTITVFFVEEESILALFFGLATLACFLGAVIILISLVGERLKDSKKDKVSFSKREGIK